MKDMNLEKEELTDEEIEHYQLLMSAQQQELSLEREQYDLDVVPTRLALDCIDTLTRLISTNITFDNVLQGAIDKQLTTFVKALTIEGKGETK